MTSSTRSGSSARDRLRAVEAAVEVALAGKREAVRLVLVAMVARGHVLLEDPPGVGKTTLAEAVARAFGADFGRIQFTADLMPADITGVEVFDPKRQDFVFHPGPIFHHVVLADEINRASPKTQSALLEAMAEGRVSVERTTHPLPDPFFVLATQNPVEHLGVFPLPEAQLDRFFLRLSLGYPDADAERQVLTGGAGRERLAEVRPVASWADLAAARAAALGEAPAPLVDYLLAVARASRARWELGISPRAARHWLVAAQILAWLEGEPFPTAFHAQRLAAPVLAHRIRAGEAPAAALEALLAEVPVPA